MTTSPRVVVVDHGAGNSTSVINALNRLGAEVELSADGGKIENAHGVILPGVGSFGTVMNGIKKINAQRWLGRRIAGHRPVLGICVGHQILFETGVEGRETEGLGEWPGVVEKLDADVLPNIGFAPVQPAKDTVLFRGIEDERFYFIHSYAVKNWEFDQSIPSMMPPQVTWSHYEEDFIAAVENGPLSGTQFHPEKSGDAGMQLLKNWLESL